MVERRGKKERQVNRKGTGIRTKVNRDSNESEKRYLIRERRVIIDDNSLLA